MRAGDKEKIGPHGLEVTRLGLGGTTFGNMYSVLSEQEGLDVLDAAFAAGVRYFDTAPLYGYGLSETRLGPGLARYNRDEIVLSSKVGYTLVERKARRRLRRSVRRCARDDQLFRFLARRGAALD